MELKNLEKDLIKNLECLPIKGPKWIHYYLQYFFKNSESKLSDKGFERVRDLLYGSMFEDGNLHCCPQLLEDGSILFHVDLVIPLNFVKEVKQLKNLKQKQSMQLSKTIVAKYVTRLTM